MLEFTYFFRTEFARLLFIYSVEYEPVCDMLMKVTACEGDMLIYGKLKTNSTVEHHFNTEVLHTGITLEPFHAQIYAI